MKVIEVENVSKKYKVYSDKSSTLKERVLFRGRNKYQEKWVLKSINFTVDKGDILALVGGNGSGKSTLLKLMSRIIYPNHGEIKVNGKVSSLLELGAGFHPDLTGIENIYSNASIFGLTKKEIDSKLQQIINFSGLEEFINAPVRTYSSGMYTRLAFSVAINVEADILLIDEILAVGDIAFQKKCFDKFEELKIKGITIVFVSHDTESVKKLCNKTIWLKEGNIEKMGSTQEVINAYLDYMQAQ